MPRNEDGHARPIDIDLLFDERLDLVRPLILLGLYGRETCCRESNYRQRKKEIFAPNGKNLTCSSSLPSPNHSSANSLTDSGDGIELHSMSAFSIAGPLALSHALALSPIFSP